MPSMKVRETLTTFAPSFGVKVAPEKGRQGVPSYSFSIAPTRPRSENLSFMSEMM